MRFYPLNTLALATLLACSPVWALVSLEEDPGRAAAPSASARHELIAMAPSAAFNLDIASDALPMAAGELMQERRVSGAPYCADAINENIQTLADGNRIVHKTSTRLCRDSEGRTRQETEVNGKKRIYISDPVAKRQWTLDPQEKTATPRRVLDIANFTRDATDSKEWRDYAQQMRDWARQFGERMRAQFGDRSLPPLPPAAAVPAVPPVPPAPPAPAAPVAPATPAALPEPVVITETQTESRGGNGRTQREVRVYRMAPTPDGAASGARTRELVTRYRLPEDASVPLPPDLPPMPALPPNIHFSTGNLHFMTPRGPGVTTPLGQRDIEGVKASGERTSWTIEAGKVGNEKPIVITREKWTSPDLMLTLSTRDADPRSGEVVYRLANLKRGEPDAALFKVPADYKVQETNLRVMRITPPASKPQ